MKRTRFPLSQQVCLKSIYLQVSLPGVLHVPHGAAVDLLQALLAPLVLLLQLLQLHPQVLPLLAELVLQLLKGRLRLGQLHLQTLLQQRDLGGGGKGENRNVFTGLRICPNDRRRADFSLFHARRLLGTDGCSSELTLKQTKAVQLSQMFTTGRPDDHRQLVSRSSSTQARFINVSGQLLSQRPPLLHGLTDALVSLLSSARKEGEGGVAASRAADPNRSGDGPTCSSRSSTFLCQLSLALPSSCSLLCANCASDEALSSSCSSFSSSRSFLHSCL